MSLDELLRDVVDAHAPLAEKAARHLAIDHAASGAIVRCDRDRMLQAFSNLIGNALKFTPPGGRVVVFARRDGEWIHLGVRDSGPGIPESELPKVFERFWQARRGFAGGLGLGLYITRAIVEAHGGRIWVESRRGEGTTFHFRLPLVRDARNAEAA